MTRRTASLTVLSALAAPALHAATLPRPASDFAVQLPGGKTAKVSDFKGKVLVLGFILTT